MFDLNSLRRAVSRASVLMMVAALSACGGGGSSGTPAAVTPPPPVSDCTDCNPVYIAMTDADGDFLSYTVAVVSLKLPRAHGPSVRGRPPRCR